MKTWAIKIAISTIGGLLGLVAGTAVGFAIFDNIFPPWAYQDLAVPPVAANEIIDIEIHNTLVDPTTDVIWILTENGAIYSNILFQESWGEVGAVPKQDFEYPSCATEWNDHPPVRRVISSAGVRFERPLSTILRCYVLFEDGRLQVWTRYTDAYTFLTIIFSSGFIGLVIGILASILLLRRVANTPIEHST